MAGSDSSAAVNGMHVRDRRMGEHTGYVGGEDVVHERTGHGAPLKLRTIGDERCRESLAIKSSFEHQCEHLGEMPHGVPRRLDSLA